MRVVTVFKDELKRSSWIIFIVLGCMFLSAVNLVSGLEESFSFLLNGYMDRDCINTVSWYLPVPVLLALSQRRTKKDDFWGSMPYTANGLYLLRLLYGIGFIALVGLVQLILSAAIMDKYAFLSEDLSFLGVELNTVVYAYPKFLLVNIGAYIIANTIYGLVNNRFSANAMLLFIAFMPEMLFTPVQWIKGDYPDFLDNLCTIKYIIACGLNDFNIKSSVYNTGISVYIAIIAAMLALGIYANKKSCEKGSSRLFYNKLVKVIFIILCVLFALNVIETLFLQGGF